MECKRPRCQAQAGHGRFGRFCAECAADYERMATEMKEDAARRQTPSGQPRQRAPKTPICCTPGCYNPRQSPRAFCEACLSAGALEEVY